MEKKGYSEGFSVGLEDFFIPNELQENVQTSIQDVSPLLHHLRSSYNELVELQLENHLKLVKMPAINFILKSSLMSDLIDSKSDSATNRMFQQIRGKIKTLSSSPLLGPFMDERKGEGTEIFNCGEDDKHIPINTPWLFTAHTLETYTSLGFPGKGGLQKSK
ncbi:hypothetical protein LguiB_027597 [Lonicera macranthoides]